MSRTTRDAKLLQYLNEAYGKEKELETALQAHIGMTTKKAYSKRLRDHLSETKGHGRQLERRIKAISGQGPAAVQSVVGQAMGQAKSLAKGPLHAVRGTGEAEKMLKNAKTEYSTNTRRSPPTRRSRRSLRAFRTPKPRRWRARSAARRSGWHDSWPVRSRSSPRRSYEKRSQLQSVAGITGSGGGAPRARGHAVPRALGAAERSAGPRYAATGSSPTVCSALTC